MQNNSQQTSIESEQELFPVIEFEDPQEQEQELFDDIEESFSPVEEVARSHGISTHYDTRTGEWFAVMGSVEKGETRQDALLNMVLRHGLTYKKEGTQRDGDE